MKKITGLLTMFLATTMMATAQEKQEPPKSPLTSAKNDFAEVSYSQPSKRGREIFGKLVPYGEIWRTGANASTDITLKKDITVAGKELKAGTYSIFTIPQEKEWTVIFNSVPQQRGASEYEKNKDKNVLEVKAPVTKLPAVQEKFTINLTDNSLSFEWDNVKTTLPIKAK